MLALSSLEGIEGDNKFLHGVFYIYICNDHILFILRNVELNCPLPLKSQCTVRGEGFCNMNKITRKMFLHSGELSCRIPLLTKQVID